MAEIDLECGQSNFQSLVTAAIAQVMMDEGSRCKDRSRRRFAVARVEVCRRKIRSEPAEIELEKDMEAGPSVEHRASGTCLSAFSVVHRSHPPLWGFRFMRGSDIV